MLYSSNAFTRPAFGLVAAALIGAGAPVFAAEREVIVSEHEDVVVGQIHFADLDLSSARDQGRLHSRVNGTIENMCTAATDGYGLNMLANRNMRACTRGAWNQAQPQMEMAIQRAAGRVALARTSAVISAAVITISLPR